MQCPRCGAASDVLSTRPSEHHSTRRRRQCHNGHRFATLEVLPAATSRKTLQEAARAALAAAARWRRDRAIRKDPRPVAEIAREHGLTGARVRQIRSNNHG